MLYVSLIRPHLEYAVPIWSPYLRGDIENVQNRATRLATRIKRKNYKYRKLIKNKIDHVNLRNDLLEKDRGVESGPADNLRRQGVCFHRELGKVNSIGENFFTNRVIPLWNDLPVGVKEARTLNSFKAGLDKLKVFTIE